MLALTGLIWQSSVPESWQFSRAFLPNKAHFFALGVVSQAVVRGERGALRRYGAVAAVAVAICATHGNTGKLLPPLVWSVCLAAQLRPTLFGLGLLNRSLRSRTALWLGAISYPIYLVNEPIHKALTPLVSRFAAGDALTFTLIWIPAAVLLPIVVSAWLHKHIEAPAMRWRQARIAPAFRCLLEPPAGTECQAPVTASKGQPMTVQQDSRGL
jgi:peptidoglycan/LPS O-acetylase OafA/YrhL